MRAWVWAVWLMLAAGAAVPAQDLPTVPFGLPEDTVTPIIDPVMRPPLLRVQGAFGDLVATYWPERTPGGKWQLMSESEAAARLGRLLLAEDAALEAAAGPFSRRRAEWLAATLHAADAALGPEAAIDRATLAVAIERQLAANAIVFRDYFPGTDVASVVGTTTQARQAAIQWALDKADAVRADGDRALADRLAMAAFVWAQTLSQGAAARAVVRPLRAEEGPLAAIEALSEEMAKARMILRYLELYQLSADQLAVTDASLTAAMAGIEAGIREMSDSGLDLAASILPRPLSLEALRARLGADEALILVLQGEFQFTVFAVSRTEVRWHVTKAYILDIDAGVEALLGGIGAWSTRSAAPLMAATTTPAEVFGAQAHWLWQEMLAPVRPVTAGKARLLISATGTAAHLPWQMLVTAPPAPGARFEDLAWLVRDQALVVVPALEALGPAPAGDGLSYLGFGAPDYAAGLGTWAERNAGAPVVGLTPLPEAAGEVAAVGALYPADRRVVLTGAAASEKTLLDLSQAGQLAAVDVLHFATHGLIWGDHPEVTEGLIALTPSPEAPPPVTQLTVETLFSGAPDGALTESEIRGLWLTARLVILSACKTAAGQASDRDGVEGLAAAFLHAGARRVMASHWPVNSRAAVEIVTAMMAADPGLQDPARALQGAMLGLIAEGGRKADPAYWAPFSIIGAP